MTNSQRLHRILGSRILRNTGIILLALFVLYTVFGFFILPRIIQSQAREFALQKLHRTLSIEKVEFNPFTLLASIHGLKLMEAHDSGEFASFESLTVKVSAKSIFHLAPVVQEVLLSKPSVHVIRLDAHHYNFDELVADLAGPPTPPKPDQQPVRFSVYNIQIEGGRFEFDDKPKGAVHVVSDFKLGVPFVSSFESEEEVFVEPLLHAKINGAPLHLAGKARPYAEPREAVLDLDLDDVDVTHYLEYLPFEPQFKVPSAQLTMHVSANFRQAKGRAPALLLSGGAALKSLQLTEMNGKPVLSLPLLEVKLGKSDVFDQQFNIAGITLDGLTADLAQERDGRLNLQRLFDAGKTAGKTPEQAQEIKPAAQGAPARSTNETPASHTTLQLTIDQIDIKNAGLHYVDGGKAMQADVQKFALGVHGTKFDLGKRTVSVAEIGSTGADILYGIGQHATAPITAAPGDMKATVTTEQNQPPFLFTVDKIGLDNWTARVDDRSHQQAVTTTLGPLSLKVQNFSTARAALADLDLKAAINKSGQLVIGGKFGLSPAHMDLTLDAKSVDLLGVQPYITDQVNLLLTSANLTAKGGLKLDRAEGTVSNAWNGGFKGSVLLGNLATVDKISGDEFLRWKSLSLDGVDVKLAPFALAIDQVTLSDFFSRIIIDPKGHFNLQDIVRTSPDDKKSLTSATPTQKAAPTPPPPAPPATPPPPIKIGKLILQGGKVRYTDNLITPHYTANLMDLGGKIGGLSSDPASRASVDLHGTVNDAPLTIAGAVNPLKGDLSLDIQAKVTGMELAPLSPYSGRYVGYGIEEGKLSFEVAYKVEQRKLTAQNRLILDQLTFGAKVDSPLATKLPVQFAVSLLRDRNGVIDVNLPIGGSLDDPDFSVGGIIVKVIFNVIEKAVTAPFAMLGSLFGGGEEMSTMAFDPGSYTITHDSEGKLTSLSKALTERPALKLEMTGWADPDSDRPALKRVALDAKVRALKVKDLAARNIPNDDQVVVTAQDYPALLKRAYQAEKFTKPRNAIGIAKDLSVPEMEKLMLDNTTIADDDLLNLGSQRAQAVKDWLLENGKIPGERLFIVASKSGPPTAKEGKNVAPGRVDLGLR
ncbi:MAG TPA: DUF748 domain-containing protein [Burkholderiaceae bacterium]|jgi:hypothetical protein